MDKVAVNQVTYACLEIFKDKKEFELPLEYHYCHLPLCVIDAVFSIGVRYQSVTNTINRFCNYFKIDKFSSSEGLTVSGFLNLIEGESIQSITDSIFVNRQRTSSKNGILKTEAVIRFHKTLQKFQFESLMDVKRFADNNQLEDAIGLIPGQKSGISFKYFLMLAGTDDLIKPDRMIRRFLESLGIKGISLYESQILFNNVAEQMNSFGFNLSPRKLDNLIWNYQRQIDNYKR
jgi:hypothetical protein